MRAATFLLGSAIAACIPMRPRGSPDGWPRTDWIVDARTGEKAAFEALIADLAQADVVFVGEDHDNPHHHHVQARIATALLEKKPDLAIGLEMLQTTHQPVADRFVAGEIDLDAFAKETEWTRAWGFPISLYKPLFDVAREKKAPVLALNAPAKLVSRLSKGGIEGLTPDERALLPELDLANLAHRDFVRKAFEAHHPMKEDRFQRAYAVQVLWDEQMAATTAGALEKRPVLVVAGTGHLIRRLGIPSRVERRKPAVKMRVVLPVSEPGRKGIDPGDGDWFWITQP